MLGEIFGSASPRTVEAVSPASLISMLFSFKNVTSASVRLSVFPFKTASVILLLESLNSLLVTTMPSLFSLAFAR